MPPISRFPSSLLAALLLLLPSVTSAQIRPLGLVLPTKNDNIFGRPDQFYMYTDRSFEGENSKPWQAGQFGNVRDPIRTKVGIVYTRFHEGVDIRPLHRDAAGEPTDPIRAIADGTIVHINPARGGSNYGIYVVVEHDWGYGPFYSLYAHLASIHEGVEVGQKVTAGQPFAVLGYTGVGLDRTRAHLHLEFCMRLSSRFDDWHTSRFREPNLHGNYNGINLAGLDIAALYAAHKKNPALTLPGFILGSEPYYRIRVPNTGPLEIAENYPWLLRDGPGTATDPAHVPSWEITFSAIGIPLKITPAEDPTTLPALTWVKEVPPTTSHSHLTRDRLGGSGAKATLRPSGADYIQILTGAFPARKTPAP